MALAAQVPCQGFSTFETRLLDLALTSTFNLPLQPTSTSVLQSMRSGLDMRHQIMSTVLSHGSPLDRLWLRLAYRRGHEADHGHPDLRLQG